MPPALSESVRQRVNAFLAAGHLPSEIARVEGISKETVYRIRRCLLTYGEPRIPRTLWNQKGPKFALDLAACEAIQAFIEAKPWAYQSEIQDYLLDECGIAVDQSTVSRTLKRLKITQKSLRRIAAERSEALRLHWCYIRLRWTASQLIFLDESGANEYTCFRKREWSALGVRPTVSVSLARSERYSILPAYCVDGIPSHFVYQGGIGGATFLWFIRELVLPHCTPYPGPRSIIVCDNASAHKVDEVRDLCEASGVLLEFLPPYSPDFNPIEELFSVIKAWMKRNHEILDTVSIDDFIELAVIANKDGRYARNHFRHAGYIIDN